MKTAVIKTFILLIVLLTAAAFPYRAYAEESVIIDGYSADIPPELEKSLSDAGITPQSIDSEALSVDKVISNVTGMLWESIKSPLKLLISLISVTLLCSIANVFADNTSGNLKTVFSLVSVLACSTITVSAASDSLTAASKTLESGSVFLASFIPAFAGILATSGHVSSAAMFNTVVMGGAQGYMQLASKILMPVSMSILGISLAGSVCGELKLETLAQAVKKTVIWILGLIMTVFVALLAMQSFITVPSDNVGIKAARFTVSNGVPFIGGAVSDSLSVMYGGIGIIRNNFGVFGIITGGVLILPSIISVLCYKLAFSLAASFSDLFGISQLTGLMKCAEGVSSIITAMLVSFLLMAVISISLMIFYGRRCGMTEIKQAALCICILGAATGLLRMLIPSEKYKTRITFLIACIFSLCLINAVKGIIPSVSIDTQAINVPQVDFSEKLSEQARVTAARAVREKIEQLLCNNGFDYDKVYVIAHIDGAFCISITEVELVFNADADEAYISDAVALVQAASGDEITVRYSKSR